MRHDIIGVVGRWLALAAGAAMLAGCGGKDESPADSHKDSLYRQRTIEFWHIQTYDPTGPAVTAAVKRAEADHPGLTVKVEAIKNDPYKEKLATAMGSGSPPDVFHTWGGGTLASYVRAGKVMDLTGDVTQVRGLLNPAAMDFCTVEGRLYALPVDISVVPMWYNKALFSKAGVAPPKTMDEFWEVCRKLKAAGITPVALGNAKSWPGAFYFVYMATRAGGAKPLAEKQFEDSAFIDAGEWIQRAVKEGIFNEGFNGLDQDDARRLFFSGKAAMTLMGSWLVAQMNSEAPELAPDLGVFPFPQLGRDSIWDETVVGGVNAAYAISSSTGEIGDSLTLLKRLTDETAMKEWAATGRIPALNATIARRVLGEPTAYAQLFYDAPRVQLYYDQLLPGPLALAHKETTQALFALQMTPAEAAKKMAETAAAMP